MEIRRFVPESVRVKQVGQPASQEAIKGLYQALEGRLTKNGDKRMPDYASFLTTEGRLFDPYTIKPEMHEYLLMVRCDALTQDLIRVSEFDATIWGAVRLDVTFLGAKVTDWKYRKSMEMISSDVFIKHQSFELPGRGHSIDNNVMADLGEVVSGERITDDALVLAAKRINGWKVQPTKY